MKTTSKISADLITPHLPNLHEKIVDTLTIIKRGTFRQIAEASGLRSEQVWKRLSELERQNKIIANGITLCSVSNRPVTVWEIKNNYIDNQ